MLKSLHVLTLSVALFAGASAKATPVGDTFDFGWDGFFNDAIGQWTWGADEGAVGVTFDNAGGTVGNFTFGTPETFSFLGNDIRLDTFVTETGPTSETWSFVIESVDGGPIFDPIDGLADNGGFFRAWHLREIFIGGEGESIVIDPNTDPPTTEFVWNTADMIQSDTFVDFASPVGLQAWTSADSTSTWFSGEELASTGQTDGLRIGDLDFDGLVNDTDRGIWEANFGKTGVEAFQEGDANGDTVVDAADYTSWRDNLGADTRLLPEGVEGFFARAELPADTSDTTTGIVLNRQFDNPGLIVYDDGVFQAQNPEVSRIEITVDVTTTGAAATAIPEPTSVMLGLAGVVGLALGRRQR